MRSTMLCSEFEVRLCEYLDGAPEQRREVEEHARGCASCAALLWDARALSTFIERTPAVEAPPELVTNILYKTQMGSPAWRAATGGWRAWWRPLLEPRFAMGMAMTVLSVSMLYRLVGLPTRQVEAADLNPARIWQQVDEKARRLWRRGSAIYQNVRLLYQIQSQLPAAEAEEETAPPKRSEEAPESERRSQNQAPAAARRQETAS